MNVGKAIKYYRTQKLIFASRLSKKMKKSSHHITVLEFKSIEFHLVTLLEVSKALDITIQELLTKAEEYD